MPALGVNVNPLKSVSGVPAVAPAAALYAILKSFCAKVAYGSLMNFLPFTRIPLNG